MAQALRVEIIGDASSYQRSLKTAGAETQTFGSTVTKTLGKAAMFTGITVGAAELVKFGVAAVKGAAQEKTWADAIKANFGTASKEVLAFADIAPKLGLLDDAALSTSANFGILFKNLGIGQSQAAAMTVGWERLGTAIATIKGQDPADVIQRLTLAAAGNTRGLKAMGIVVDAASIKQEAFRMGLIKSVSDGITPAIKAQAIYSLAMKNLSDFQQQAATHAGDLTVKQRVLSAEWDQAQDKLGAAFLPAVTKLATFFADVLPGAIAATTAAVKLLLPFFTAMGTVMITPLRTIIALLQGDWAAAWDALQAPVLAARDAILGALAPLAPLAEAAFGAVSDAATTAWDMITGATTTAWDTITGAVTTAWGEIQRTVTTALSTIQTAVTTTWSTIQTTITTVWNTLSTGATTTWNAIQTAITTVLTAIQTSATTTWNTIRTVITTAVTGISTVVTTAWNTLRTISTTTWNAIQLAITTAVNIAKAAVTTAVNVIKSLVTFAGLSGIVSKEWNEIKSAITGAINAAKAVVTTATGAMKTAVNATFSAFGTVGAKLKSLIIDPINYVIGKLNSIRIPGFSIHIPSVSVMGVEVFGGADVGFPGLTPFSIPKLAQGGIVTKPMIALLGERGPEAVVPLGKGQPRPGGYDGPQTVQLILDGSVLGEFNYRDLVRRKGRNFQLGIS